MMGLRLSIGQLHMQEHRMDDWGGKEGCPGDDDDDDDAGFRLDGAF